MKLLERIIKASSNENDIVFDPFMGSGTALVAAKELNRRWLGCDLSDESAALVRTRLDECGQNLPAGLWERKDME